MNLHENYELLLNYVALASVKEEIDEAIILKDYFVTLILKMIFSRHDDIVFIGGTSLSKCFNIIKRFSEDVDLVSSIQSRKGKQRSTHVVIKELKDLWNWEIEENNNKFQDFKEMYLYYTSDYVSELDQRVKVELLSFTQPFPIVDKSIEPIIYKYLSSEDKETYSINPFVVKTQEPYRTMLEKIILEKELYKEHTLNIQSDESQEKRARDFYDIHKIWEYYKNALPFQHEVLIEIINSRINNRRDRTTITIEEFNKYPLHEMFLKREIRKQLETIDFEKLTIRDLDCDAIEKSLREIDKAFTNVIHIKQV